ncbi:hypothetical protein FBUS_09207 [Fasciolopsis buskii]|uniref:Uncharacterized protein n=1 Tax=Fasciolopsis buskii TaxID=27845 RepID=A0A8E0VPC2_9TREM|nr:hypothetical protein FBUS_09207 [Fasciolopsis buski]
MCCPNMDTKYYPLVRLSGTLGDHELGVQTVLSTLDTVTYSILPYGFGTAVGIRVGHHLGAGCSHGPRFTLSVALLAICKSDHIGIVNTRIFFFQAVCIGVIKGSGLQKYGAIINFTTLYILGAPSAVCFVYVMKMGLEGGWFSSELFKTVIFVSLSKSSLLFPSEQMIGLESNSNASQLTPNKCHTLNQERLSSFGPLRGSSSPPAMASALHKKKPEPCRRPTADVVRNRIILIVFMLLLLAVSLACRLCIDWSALLGSYCVYPNGTYVRSMNLSQTDNCVLVVP